MNATTDTGKRSKLAEEEDLDDVKTKTQKQVQLRRMTTQAAGAAVTHAATQDRSLHVYSSLLSGICSGVASSFVCAPLDLIRTRLQVWNDVVTTTTAQSNTPRLAFFGMVKDIVKREGITGCFRGLSATLFTVPTFWGVYFPLYDDCKFRLSRQFPNMNLSFIHMSSAVTAGAISDILCNPMFVIRTRLMTESIHQLQKLGMAKPRKNSILQTAKSLYQEGGLPIFWRGMTANLLGLSHVAVQFPTYEFLKKYLRRNNKEETALELLTASILSKMTASLLTYPHEVIRSRMMDSRKHKVQFLKTCRKIYYKEGIQGFYVGLPISLVRVLPNTAVTFTVYELSLRYLRSRSGIQ